MFTLPMKHCECLTFQINSIIVYSIFVSFKIMNVPWSPPRFSPLICRNSLLWLKRMWQVLKHEKLVLLQVNLYFNETPILISVSYEKVNKFLRHLGFYSWKQGNNFTELSFTIFMRIFIMVIFSIYCLCIVLHLILYTPLSLRYIIWPQKHLTGNIYALNNLGRKRI